MKYVIYTFTNAKIKASTYRANDMISFLLLKITFTNRQPYLPTQATSIPNLVLAGAHTKTAADVWSIEGAVESGRRAAQVIEPSVVVIPQYKPLILRAIGAVDDILFAIHAPHILDIVMSILVLAIIFIILIVFIE